MSQPISKTIRSAFIKSLPVMAGYVVLGIGFGIASYSAGLGIWWPVLMSIFVYSGTLEFLAVDLLSGGASFITVFISAIVVSARHIFYGISMLSRYKGARRKWYMIFALTDETYALNVSIPESADYHEFCFFTSLLNQIYWVAGSAIGVIFGRIIPFDFKGIDFMLTALFVSVVTDQCIELFKASKKKCFLRSHYPVIIGFVCSVVCLMIFGSESFLVPSMLSIVILLCIPEIMGRAAAKKRDGADVSCSTAEPHVNAAEGKHKGGVK